MHPKNEKPPEKTKQEVKEEKEASWRKLEARGSANTESSPWQTPGRSRSGAPRSVGG